MSINPNITSSQKAIAFFSDTGATSLEFPLKKPVTLKGETSERSIDKLTFRRPKIGDYRGLKMGGDSPQDSLFDLAVRLSGEARVVIDAIDGVDALDLIEIMSVFLSKSPAIGAN